MTSTETIQRDSQAPGRGTGDSFASDFPVARIGGGAVAHQVCTYLEPVRSICGRPLADSDEVVAELDLPLCAACDRIDVPTEAEYMEGRKCTDCGVDAVALGETAYRVLSTVFETAYPGYPSVGLGSSRPCIGCLEARLGRRLTAHDFDMEWGPEERLSDRLNERLTGIPNWKSTPETDFIAQAEEAVQMNHRVDWGQYGWSCSCGAGREWAKAPAGRGQRAATSHRETERWHLAVRLRTERWLERQPDWREDATAG